jgi:hypothetical protein
MSCRKCLDISGAAVSFSLSLSFAYRHLNKITLFFSQKYYLLVQNRLRIHNNNLRMNEKLENFPGKSNKNTSERRLATKRVNSSNRMEGYY